ASEVDRRGAGRVGGCQPLDLGTGNKRVAHAGEYVVEAFTNSLPCIVARVVDIIDVVVSAAKHYVDAGAAIQSVVSREAEENVSPAEAVDHVAEGGAAQ